MEWLNSLFFGNESFWGGGVAHSVLILALVIALGIMLGKIKVAGISLGVTWILFVGIIFSHFGMRLNEHLIHFMKEFGLILFVYSIGLQVGPGFFSSFKKGGVRLNLLATMVVCAGVLVTCGLYVITGLPVTTMVGILSGAVTNTPGLGAAQQAYSDMTGIDSARRDRYYPVDDGVAAGVPDRFCQRGEKSARYDGCAARFGSATPFAQRRESGAGRQKHS